MREILFRGKRLDNGEWAEGYLYEHEPALVGIASENDVQEPSKWFIARTGFADWNMPRPVEFVEIDPSTVGQYTGLKDKNGKRIFEGDVCRFREWSKGEMCWVGKVLWEHQQFMISGGPNKECETMFELCLSRFIPENIEVIGNIHDNPELLEK